MKAIIRLLIMLSLIWFSSCNDAGRIGREEQRIREEVDQRVDVIRSEMKISESRWHTVRIVAFCLLAGGSLIWLFNGGGLAGRENKSPDPSYRRRVIDRNYDDDESDEHPYRR